MNPAAEIAQAAPQIDMSFWTLFWHAHIVVKIVMLGLLGASVWCWSIIVDKTLLYRRTRRDMDAFEEVFWSGRSLEELYRELSNRPVNDMAAIFVAAMREWKRSFENGGRSVASLSQRIDKVLDVTIQRETERLESKLLVLSTVASAAPFIGLFGTVWGIMNSFIGISQSKTTNLAVVAPGIAEALLATAIGLVAAIPAVIIYNVFSRAIAGYRATLSDASGEVLRHLSRDLERARRAAVPPARAALHAVPPQPAAMPRVPAE